MEYEADQLKQQREVKQLKITLLQAEIVKLESDHLVRMEACSKYHAEVSAKILELEPLPVLHAAVDNKARELRREELLKNTFTQEYIDGHGFKGLDLSTFKAIFSMIEPVLQQLDQDAPASVPTSPDLVQRDSTSHASQSSAMQVQVVKELTTAQMTAVSDSGRASKSSRATQSVEEDLSDGDGDPYSTKYNC